MEAAVDALLNNQISAIVRDAPVLEWYDRQHPEQPVTVVGPLFRPEKYGIAVANGSALRKRINEALLAMYEDGTYEQIYGKWFSSGK